MCGLAGLVTPLTLTESHCRIVAAMTEAQSHRGPDDAGLEAVASGTPAAIFGHRRLAIIDLSAAGHQPMVDPANGNWITFVGEIYNYRQLRADLAQRGALFHTQTDTEVILKAYTEWGHSCTQHLRGMFAFAIWDNQEQTAFLARDQLGVKPLYYWHHDGTLLFAAEVRALLASGLVPRCADLKGLRSYLAYGSVQEPYTLVENVHSLLPGHTLTWRDGIIRVGRYWQLPQPGQANGHHRAAPVYETVRDLLAESVELQLVADVPLGAFLSGGIDSSAIAALAQQAAERPVNTFSIIFDETTYDERDYARLAAVHTGTRHSELQLTSDMVVSHLDRAIAAYDQPSMDGLNTYFVAKATREAGLVVALSGVGGDELFGGYNGYHKQLLAERWSRHVAAVPPSLRPTLANGLRRLAVRESLRRAADLFDHSTIPYFLTRQVFSTRQVSALLEPGVVAASANWQPLTFARLAAETRGYDAINRSSALELQTYMLSTLLRDTDQMSMAHALEVRVPLLDHKLVEYLFTLPGALKLDDQQPKPLLTWALNDDIPAACVHRPKQGFVLPFDLWLREALRPRLRETLLGASAAEAHPFQPAGLKKVWQQFEIGQISWSRVWSLFMLQSWLKTHRITI